MIKKTLMRGLAVAVLSVGLLCFGATAAFADTTIKANPKKGSDAVKVIQKQLDKAHKKATSKNKYIVKVKPGSYKLGGTLKVYSNTTLDLTGVKLKATKKASNMIKVGATPMDKKKGYAYKNITIMGGDLNNAGHGSTCVVIAHAKNVQIKDMKIHNSKNAHLVEVAGTNGFTVDGCQFYDQKQTKKAKVATPEAIQIDILVKKHMKTYRSEVLPMKNVVVKNSSFRNVPRGVGSHTAVLNSPVTNATFQNNTFTDCKSGAIQVLNYQNCTIEGNKIEGAPRGIVVYSVNTKGVFLPSTLAKEGKVKSKVSSKYKKPKADQKIVIRNNSITLKGKDIYAESENEGILVSGFKFAKKLKKNASTDAIPKGDYYVSGVMVEGNTIVSNGQGIRLSNTRNAVVSSNKISFNNPTSKTGLCYGIQLTNESTSNQVIANAIVNPKTHGIFLAEGSSATKIESNAISGAGRYGIGVQGSKATLIKGNTIKNAKEIGISVIKSSSVGVVADNILSNTGSYGIYAKNKSKITSVYGNVITGADRDIFRQ